MHQALKTVARRALPMVALALAACIHRTTPFEQYLSQQQWADAARTFESDTTLRNNESAVFAAAVLYGTPGRPTYNPGKARETWRMFLTRFPLSSRRGEATERLGLLDALLNSQRDAQARQQELEDRIAELTRETRMLRARVDSMAVQGDSVRAALVRAENERRDREAQINALRLELQRLKEIDLKRPAKPIRPI